MVRHVREGTRSGKEEQKMNTGTQASKQVPRTQLARCCPNTQLVVVQVLSLPYNQRVFPPWDSSGLLHDA